MFSVGWAWWHIPAQDICTTEPENRCLGTPPIVFFATHQDASAAFGQHSCGNTRTETQQLPKKLVGLVSARSSYTLNSSPNVTQTRPVPSSPIMPTSSITSMSFAISFSTHACGRARAHAVRGARCVMLDACCVLRGAWCVVRDERGSACVRVMA